MEYENNFDSNRNMNDDIYFEDFQVQQHSLQLF